MKPQRILRCLAVLSGLALGTTARAQTAQVQASVSLDGRQLVIIGSNDADQVDLRLTGDGSTGEAELLSKGAVILRFTAAQRAALRECRVDLYGGDDRFLVHDTVAQPFSDQLLWTVDAGDGDDVVVLHGPAEGTTEEMVQAWLALRPQLEASGGALVTQTEEVMVQQVAWAEAQVRQLLTGKSAALQTRALTLVDRLVGDSPDSLVRRTAARLQAMSDRIAKQGPESLTAREGLDAAPSATPAPGPNAQGLPGILGRGLPWDGETALYDPTAALERIAEQEARMERHLGWLPESAADEGDAGLDTGAAFARDLAFAQDISLALESLAVNVEADILAACDPASQEFIRIGDRLTADSARLGDALTAEADQALTPLEGEITDGPAGTDSFQAAVEAFEAEVIAAGEAEAADVDRQVLAIMASLTNFENQMSAVLQRMDVPADPGAGAAGGRRGARALTLPPCQITPQNAISGGPGTDLLIGTPLRDRMSGGAGADFLFGLGEDDILNGDDGVDFLFGMDGNDDLNGGDGTDFLFGDAFFWTGNDCLHGNDGVDIMLGEKGDDGMDGGDKLDLMIGGAGNDVMLGGAGNDLMLGWTGDDSMEGGDETDLMLGDYPLAPPGDDTIEGSGGNTFTIASVTYELGDIQFGNDGVDTITGEDGIDFQFGNRGDDIMSGEDNIDLMFGGDGKDTMEGELGGTLFEIDGVPIRFGNLMFGNKEEDTMTGGGDFDLMFGNDADDSLTGGKNSSFHLLGIDVDIIFGNDGDDYVDGHHKTDLIFGGPGNDELHGDLGLWYQILSSDIIFGNDGDDRIFGGNGNDLCFGNRGDDVVHGNWDLLIDMLFGNDGDDIVDGDGGADLIFGNGGNDILLGGHGLLDIIFGNDGDDRIFGQGGVDLCFGNRGRDYIEGGPLSDILFGNADDDTISGGDWPDLIFGNDGCDTLSGDNSADIVFGNDGDDLIHGNDGIDFLFGNRGNDTIFGDDGLDTVFGGDDNDIIRGGNGPDVLFGNSGSDDVHGDDAPDLIFGNDGPDCLYGDNGPDLIFGNDGNDNIHGGAGLDLLFGNDGNDCVFGEGGIAMIFGGAGNDDLYGGSDPDVIFGQGGDDSIRSFGGRDMILGNDGSDDINAGDGSDILVFGNDGNDRMHGGSGNDWMFGNGGDDRMWGNDGNDKLFGNSGNDVLDGGNGNDLLAGGSGNDSLFGGPGTDVLSGGTGSDSKDKNGSTPEDSQWQAACGRICGKKWLDLNHNGQWDAGEPGLGGVTIYIDTNNNRLYDAGEPKVVTQTDNPATCADETGCYCFYNLAPGTYTLREVIPAGFEITFPVGNAHVFTLAPGEKRDGVNFGNARPQECYFTVRGCKFLDKNQNGKRDPDEMLLPGVTIFHDVNHNGILDAGEPSTVTGQDGCYALNFPYNGTVCITWICEVVPATMVPTFPAGGCQEIDVFACGEAPFRVDFGNAPHSGSRGTGKPKPRPYVGKDDDCDGIVGPDEPGLGGLTVWFDVNRNGVPDAGEPTSQTAQDDPATPEDETGLVIDPVTTPEIAATSPLRLLVPMGLTAEDPARLPLGPPWRADDGRSRLLAEPLEGPGTGEALPESARIGLMTDADNDGYPDLLEARAGTSPTLADSDGDGLNDGFEARIGTDPRQADSDGDGLSDGDEIEYGTDPGRADSDGDGLSDGVEIAAGLSPFHADSDRDGLPDSEEAPGAAQWSDRDHDGLSDARELALGTDPALADSDGDGESDSSEVLGGTDPRQALDNAASALTSPRNGRIIELLPQSDGTLRLTVLKALTNRSLHLRRSATLENWTDETVPVPEGASATLLVPMEGGRGYFQFALPDTEAP